MLFRSGVGLWWFRVSPVSSGSLGRRSQNMEGNEGTHRQILVAGWSVVVLAAAFFALMTWSAIAAAEPVTLPVLIPSLIAITFVVVGFGVVRLRPLARRVIVAAAWLFSLYAAVFVVSSFAAGCAEPDFLLQPPDFAPLRDIWWAMVLLTVVHFFLLVESLALWWLFTRQPVKELFQSHANREGAAA